MGPFARFRESLSGTWLVMRGRPEGLDRLDLSIEGFWRSFALILLILPLGLLGAASEARFVEAVGAGEPAGAGTGPQALLYVVDWAAFPLLFAALAPLLGLGPRYVPFIVTRNWASLILAALVSVIHAGHLAGAIPSQLVSYLLLAAMVVALRFFYVIARVTLGVSLAAALPIVLLDLLTSLTIQAAFEQLRGG